MHNEIGHEHHNLEGFHNILLINGCSANAPCSEIKTEIGFLDYTMAAINTIKYYTTSSSTKEDAGHDIPAPTNNVALKVFEPLYSELSRLYKDGDINTEEGAVLLHQLESLCRDYHNEQDIEITELAFCDNHYDYGYSTEWLFS